MICKDCQKDIDNDSKFCEFCGTKVKNVFEVPIETLVVDETNRDLENLKSKPWYRFLKVIYFIGFCVSIFYIGDNFLEKKFHSENIIIDCTGRQSSEKNSGPVLYNLTSYRVKYILEPSCSGKNWNRININFYGILKFILYSLLTIVFFESLRQVGYYIFLGRMYHSRLVARLIKRKEKVSGTF